jgi:hypothetical protein
MITRLRLFLLTAVLAASAAIAQTLSPFLPQGTANIAVTASAQTLTLPAPVVPGILSQLVLTNIGTQTVFARWDGTTATVSNAMPLLANSQVIVSVPTTTTALSVISASTGSTLYATIGAGQ